MSRRKKTNGGPAPSDPQPQRPKPKRAPADKPAKDKSSPRGKKAKPQSQPPPSTTGESAPRPPSKEPGKQAARPPSTSPGGQSSGPTSPAVDESRHPAPPPPELPPPPQPPPETTFPLPPPTDEPDPDIHPAIALLNRPLGDNEWIPIPLEELLRQIQSAPPPAPAAPVSIAWMTLPLAAVLAGLAAGWQWFGFRMMTGAILDPLPGTTTILAAIALLAAALGPWLPLKVLPRFATWLQRRRQPPAAGDPADPANASKPSWLHRVVRERDEPLLWTSVAILASAAGGMAVLMLALASSFTTFYHYLLDHFFWTDATLAILEWLGLLVVTAPMWLLNGLVAAAILLAAARRWPLTQAGAAVLVGGTIGWAMADASHHQWTDLGLSCEQQILLGIVPMFMLAGLAVLMSQDAARAPIASADTDSDAPETADGNERLIWLAMLVWAIGSGLALAGWTAGRDMEWLWRGPRSASDRSAYPLFLAAGAILGWLSVRQRMPGGPGCGMAVWSAGVGAGLAATLAAHWTDTLTTLRSAVLAAPAGYTLAYTQTAWLARAGRRGLALAHMSFAILGGLGLGMAAGQWLALPLLGPVGSMAAGALVLLAFGGLVQIFARPQSGGTQHLRLAMIFAALAAALAVFPSNVRLWSHACAARPALASPPDLAWLITQAPRESRRFCIIGDPRSDLLAGPGLTTVNYLFPPTADNAATSGTQHRFPNACRTLRESHDYYDLIYQYGPLPAAGPRYLGYSLEWLRTLARHQTLGGRVVLDVPRNNLNPAAEASIARTFQRALGQPCVCCRTQANNRPVLRLATSIGAPLDADWQTVQDLLNSRPGISLHSLRRDAISRAQRAH